MITDDLKITRPDYWNQIYQGRNNDAPVDASNTKRPANAFDRFAWAAMVVDGPYVLGVASGHAHVEKRIRVAHPDWLIAATDQAVSAKTVAKFEPYWAPVDAYHLPELVETIDGALDSKWSTVVICQALEYLENVDAFIWEVRRKAKHLVATLPIGEMQKWSQLRIYTEENVKQLLEPYGKIEVFERQGDLLLVKLKFND